MLCSGTNPHKWILLLVILGALGDAAAKAQNLMAQCEAEVCAEAKRHAESLNRLNLLKGYIEQTLQLMTSMVTSLEEELTNTSSDLSDFLGPQCQEVHSTLQSIRLPPGGRRDVDDDYHDVYVGETPGTLDVDLESSSSGGQDQEQRPTYVAPLQPQLPEGHGSKGHIKTTGDLEFGKIEGNSANADITLETVENSVGGSTVGGGTVTGTSVTGNECRGVEEGAPFWVPGLDEWCRNNCAMGHCPSTHCVCGSRNEVQCRGVEEGAPFWVPGLDKWCRANCAIGNCPPTQCVC